MSVYILQQKLEKEFFENHLPRSLDKFEKILKSRGGKYFADNKVRTCGKSLSILETVFQSWKQSEKRNLSSLITIFSVNFLIALIWLKLLISTD